MKANNHGVLAALAALSIAGCSAGNGNDDRAAARCQQEVERYIKFPEEASWQQIKGRHVTDDEFNVLGEVVAPNSFGVRTRHHFGCRILVKENWALPLSVTIDGEEK